MIRRVIGIHFSPIGGTAEMTRCLTEILAAGLREDSPVDISVRTYELLMMGGQDDLELDDETVAVIGMPVYVGKVPLPAVRLLEKFHSNGATAVLAVSYGARTYGNALYELQHFAELQGFRVIGAGAFSASRAKSGHLSETGGYAGDLETLRIFGKAVAGKIRRLAGSEIEGLRVRPAPLEVAGRMPVHITSRVLPGAAAAAQVLLERLCVRRKESEWFL